MPSEPEEELKVTQQADLAQRYWDTDSETYDEWPEHGAWSSGERAAWAAVLREAIGKPPARVLDIGAGTGFLSLTAARLGCEVTALDSSPAMLERLRGNAAREGLAIEAVCAPATEPPAGPFDVVMARLVLWTLPELDRALKRWLAVAPDGQLLAFEAAHSRDYVQGLRRRGRGLVSRLRRRGLPPEHHGPYPAELTAALPTSGAAWPSGLIARVEAAGWHAVQLRRLRDVQWARELALPPFDRLFGATPEYMVQAEAGT